MAASVADPGSFGHREMNALLIPQQSFSVVLKSAYINHEWYE
jgi:hypothetical protein